MEVGVSRVPAQLFPKITVCAVQREESRLLASENRVEFPMCPSGRTGPSPQNWQNWPAYLEYDKVHVSDGPPPQPLVTQSTDERLEFRDRERIFGSGERARRDSPRPEADGDWRVWSELAAVLVCCQSAVLAPFAPAHVRLHQAVLRVHY